MKIRGSQLEETPSNKFTGPTDVPEFSSRRFKLDSTTVYLLRPPLSSPEERPWIIASEDGRLILRHPLTLKRQFWNLPPNFDLSKLNPATRAVSHNVGIHVDELFVVPNDRWKLNWKDVDVHKCTLLALFGGGQLRGCPPYNKRKGLRSSPWVKAMLLHDKDTDRFDDIAVYRSIICTVDRQGMMSVLHNHRTVGKLKFGRTLITRPVSPGSGRFAWRKRFVIDGHHLYLVVRMAERLFQVYKQMERGTAKFRWDPVMEFDGREVLFMARNYYFFSPADSEFPGREFKNCIVFSEAAFPQCGNDCWEFTHIDRQDGVECKSEDDIAIFRLTDSTFAREGESSVFPQINWSPPPWIFHAEFQSHLSSESLSLSERGRETVEDEDSDSGGEKDGEVQSDSKDSNSKDKEQEGIESEEDSQDQEQEEMETDSDSQDQEDGKMQCDSNCQEKEDEEMYANANIGGGASLQEDVPPSTDTVRASLSAEEEVTVTLLRASDGNGATEKETSRKNITELELRACTSSTTKSHISDSGTTKFEGFDIRSDLVPILQKIWRKHGNIIENSIIHSGDIVSRALESLATMVQILEDNTAQSLSDLQADYLSSTLSDLRCMCFKVYWLITFVDKALQLHKSKALVDSLNNLSQLSSQVKERRAIFLDELAKLGEEENKLKEEMVKVSKLIPLYGQVKFDEPLGLGLT